METITRIINTDIPVSIEAEKLYQTSADLAAQANEIANKGSEVLKDYNELNELLKNWDKIHDTTPYKTYTMIFLVICIVEFYFSKQIYLDIVPQMPAWLMALGLTVVSIITSKLLKKSLNRSSRDRAIFMEQRKPGNENKSIVTLRDKVNIIVRKQAILGWIFFVSIIVITTYLSYIRAQRELAAHLRIESFNLIDALPVIFYIIEVFSGLFLVYTIDRTIKGFLRHSLKDKYNKYIKRCSELTDEAVLYFKEARSKGYDPAYHAVNENIHLAFFRNMQKNTGDASVYLLKPERLYRKVAFVFISDNWKTGNATIVTECNFSAKRAFDISEGSRKSNQVLFEILGYETDAIREIIFDFPNTQVATDLIIKGNFEMNSIVHELNIDQ